ncbi:MAG: hypothetical protein ACJAUV_000186 [Flavobacteriales bacterium]
MVDSSKELTRKLSIRKILLPVLLGLLVAGYMLYNNVTEIRFEAFEGGSYVWNDTNEDGVAQLNDATEFVVVEQGTGAYQKISYKDVLSRINWHWHAWLWLFISLLMVVIRDLGYMFRIRFLTDYELSWRQSFDVIMLWEFASALTPSVVGGSGVAIYILNREGLSVGRSSAIVMVTALLDELFFILMVPLIFVAVGTGLLFPVSLEKEIFGVVLNTQGVFWVGYGFIVCLTVFILLAIIFFPRLFKFLLLKIFRLKWLQKWRYKVIQIGDDIINTSKELRGKKPSYWIKAFVATLFSWTARYWVVNFLLLTVTPVGDHLLIYGRQLVMWVIMLISPTPGGSGLAEVAFSGFLSDFIPLGLAGALALIWRLLSYYPYLFLGAIVLPKWLNRTAKNKK